MATIHAFRNYFMRTALRVLGLEALFLSITYLFYRLVPAVQYLRYSDELFVLGLLILMTAAYSLKQSAEEGYVNPDMPVAAVQPTEQERRDYGAAEFIEGRRFSLYAAAIGVLSILAAIALSYLAHI